MKRYQIWIIHSFLLIGLAVCIVFAQAGCDDNTLEENKITIYDGTKVTIINNGDYKIKVTVKFAGSISPTIYYCESIQTPTMKEWIKLINCKNFNGDLYIPYNQMKWFTYNDYNGEDE
jgi:hypothetical protein